MSYFEIKIQAKSEEELAKRVADNELRGFKVARYYDYENKGTYTEKTKYKTSDGINKRLQFNSVHKNYGAVMRRCNEEYPVKAATLLTS